MGIVNRDLDASQQKNVLSWESNTVVGTAASLMLAKVSSPGFLSAVNVSALGLSGSPQLSFRIMRFAGGQTVINAGISNMVVTAFGTSGSIGWSGIAPSGSTLLQLFAGDVLVMHTSVANTAIEQMVVDLAVKNTQDILQIYGSST